MSPPAPPPPSDLGSRTTEKYCLLTLQSGSSFHEGHASASKSLYPCKGVVRTFWNGALFGFVLLPFLDNTKLSDEGTARHVLVPCSSECPVCEPNFFFFEATKMALGGYHSWMGPGQGWGQDLGAQKHSRVCCFGYSVCFHPSQMLLNSFQWTWIQRKRIMCSQL